MTVAAALVLASANPDKAKEIGPLLAPASIQLVPVTTLVPGWNVEETGATLTENARIKARAAVDAVGTPAIADDTGLFVDALGGAPGVHASRYAGPGATYADNVRKLLAALGGVEGAERTARFRTVAVLARPDGEELVFEGMLEGRILDAPRGEHGFGYDPVFQVAGDSRSLAEIPLGEKNRTSHRARAFRAVAAFLAERPEWLGCGSA